MVKAALLFCSIFQPGRQRTTPEPHVDCVYKATIEICGRERRERVRARAPVAQVDKQLREFAAAGTLQIDGLVAHISLLWHRLPFPARARSIRTQRDEGSPVPSRLCPTEAHHDRYPACPLRANISETLLGPLITEQGENGSQRGNEEQDCSSPCPNPEVVAKPRRRTFTAEYKQRILIEADAARFSGTIGALLRREGLYSSHLVTWRRERDAGILEALTPQKRGPRVFSI